MDLAPSQLDRYRDAELTLDGLVDASARFLKRLDVRQKDGRVSSFPDSRGVRYYQAIGIIDRPLRYDGRRAIYGFRHLLQLLAVKRLQEEGRPLKLIQQSLSGCPTPVLEHALEAVLSGPEQGPVPQTAEPPLPRTVRVSPGVTITIDPAVVGDVEGLVRRLTNAIAGNPMAFRRQGQEDVAR